MNKSVRKKADWVAYVVEDTDTGLKRRRCDGFSSQGTLQKLPPAFATNVPTAYLSERQFQELERSGRCKLDQDSRQRLLKALDDYLTQIHVYRVSPRPNYALRKHLRETSDAANP